MPVSIGVNVKVRGQSQCQGSVSVYLNNGCAWQAIVLCGTRTASDGVKFMVVFVDVVVIMVLVLASFFRED